MGEWLPGWAITRGQPFGGKTSSMVMVDHHCNWCYPLSSIIFSVKTFNIQIKVDHIKKCA